MTVSSPCATAGLAFGQSFSNQTSARRVGALKSKPSLPNSSGRDGCASVISAKALVYGRLGKAHKLLYCGKDMSLTDAEPKRLYVTFQDEW